MTPEAHDAALAEMLGARCIGGPHDGRPYIRGHSQWYGLVLPASPHIDDAALGRQVLYLWDGVSVWFFERWVELGEDVHELTGMPKAGTR